MALIEGAVMKINVDVDKYNELLEDLANIENIIAEKQAERDSVKKEMLKLFPRGYWWAFDIDETYKRPKKYSIRDVGNGYVVVKEVFKKTPWSGFDGKTRLYFNDLIKLDVYKTEDEAKHAVYNRKCPKCGGIMGYTSNKWCNECIAARWKRAQEYEKKNTFYDPTDNCIYYIGYEDDMFPYAPKGYDGQHFVFKRLDTGEVIETNNLWSSGRDEKNTNNFPLIEFIDG